jgi:hypothetical protein
MSSMPDMSDMSDLPDMSVPAGQVLSGMSPVLMTCAHLLAAVITAAVLCGAEQAALACAFALVETLLPTRALSTPRPSEPPCTATANTVPRDLRLRDVLTRRLNLRRGPPSALAPH